MKILSTVASFWCGNSRVNQCDISNPFAAYEKFAEKTGGVLWAGCWAHARRKFIEAEGQEPERSAQIISLFQRLYEIEKRARGKPKHRKKLREKESRPIVDTLFELLAEQYKTTTALDKSPYMKALNYALEREAGLRIFLENPEVPIDNNPVNDGPQGPLTLEFAEC